MKYFYIYFAAVTVISAAVPQDLCDTCVPTQDCPLFENLNVTDQLKWMEIFPCGSHKNDDYKVPAGFASAAKGDYVCCSNNIWGVEKSKHFGSRIGHQPWINTRPGDNKNYFNDEISLENNNVNNKNPKYRPIISVNNNYSYYKNDRITSNSSNNEKFNSYYYNKHNSSRTTRYKNDNIDPSNHNLEDYDFTQNHNDSTVWFPDRSRNHDNTDYWLTHSPDNNETNNDRSYWNDLPDRKENVRNTQLPPWNEARPPIDYDPPGNESKPPIESKPPTEGRPPIQYDPSDNEANPPVTSYPSLNIVQPPIQYDHPGNEAKPPFLYNRPENGANFPDQNSPPSNVVGLPTQYDPPRNEPRQPSQYDPPEGEAKPPLLYNPPMNGANPPIRNNPPSNVGFPTPNIPPINEAKPPTDHDPRGNDARPPNQYDPPEIDARPPNLFNPPESVANSPDTPYPPPNIIRPPIQYDPPGNIGRPYENDSPRSMGRPPIQNIPPGYDMARPTQYYGPEDTMRPLDQYYPPRYFEPSNNNNYLGNFGPRNENNYPGNFGPPNDNYYPGNFGSPNQYYSPSNFGQPSQYYPRRNSIPPNQYFSLENMENSPTYYPPDNYNVMSGPFHTNNFPYNNDQRSRRHNYGSNTNNPYYPGYNSLNQDKNLGNLGGGQCSLTSFPPTSQSGCCGRQLADDDRITGWNNIPAYNNNNNWGPRSGPVWRTKRSVSENDPKVIVENRISGGHATELYQYPWTVLLLTTFDYGRREAGFNCGGGLISARYVLTAGHCVYEKGATVKSVQVNLAEYDKSSFPNDCKLTGGERRCIENIVMYAEEVITHPQYENENLVNDIALLRLRGSAPYTEYIRPICLASINVDDPQFSNLQFEVSGWGRVGPYSSNIKQSTVLNLVNHNQCRQYYPQLTNKHLCAAGKRGEDTCKGDSGGPLMILYRGSYYVAGIVSGKRADSPCGTAVPSLYTNVYHYVDWIYSVIRN